MTKRRKPVGAGDAYREMQRTAKVRAQMDRERARHRAATHDLALRRQEAQAKDGPTLGVELARVAAALARESRRHRDKMADLRARITR